MSDEAKARAAESTLGQFQSVFRNMPEGCALHEVVTDEDNRPIDYVFLDINPAFERLTGLRKADVVGRRLTEVLPGLEPFWFETYGRVAPSGEPVVFERELPAPLGRWYQVCAYQPGPGRFATLFLDVTAHHELEKKLRESRSKYQALIETTNDFIWEMDALGRYTYCSPQMEKLWGLEPKEMIGKTPFDLMPAEERAAIAGLFAGLARSPQPFSGLESTALVAGGRPILIETSGVPFFDDHGRLLGFRGISRDITERRKNEALRQALAEQERLRLGAAVEQAPVAVVMLDLDGTIRYANAAFGFVNKMAKEEAKGLSYFDAFVPRSAADQMRQALAAGRAWQGSLTRPIHGGRPAELEVVLSAAMDPAGALIGGLITEKDVTHEMALQRQLRQGQKMEALGTLAGGIAHDFNNVLNPIFISMELALLEPTLEPAVRSHLEVGLKAAERGRDLVKQVIAFSRQKEKERKPFRAAPVVREAVNFLRVSLPSMVEIRSEVRDETGSVLGDPAQLQQIVMNLCSNAAYAMRQSGGVLTVNLDGVDADDELAARAPGIKHGPYLRLTVSDTGTGMTPDVKERLFDPFFTTKGPGEGSGMGLPVVAGIVRDYGGAVSVETEEGRGSTFTVFLPRGEFAEPPVESPPDDLPRGTGRVLLIDDEEAQIYSVRRMLEKLGYEVVALSDGREALDRFRSEPRGFDLVITDQTMPRLTGMQVAEELLKTRPDLPIILCTGYSEVVDAKKVRALGIREFLMKPYSVREMAEVVRRTLAGRG